MNAFEEVVEFFATGPSVRHLADFQASPETRERVEQLIRKGKNEGLSPEEKLELDDFLQLEHLMRMVKARARQKLGA
jgi:hypothetical protein